MGAPVTPFARSPGWFTSKIGRKMNRRKTGSDKRYALPTMLLVMAGVALISAAPAAADGGPATNDIQMAQTLGDRELTVIIRRPVSAPGPLAVDVVTHAGNRPGPLLLSTVPSATDDDRLPAPGSVISQQSLETRASPGSSGVVLYVDRYGPWELVVDDGRSAARIPFIVPAPLIPGWERAIYGGFATGGALLLIAIVVAVRARRTWIALIPAGGAIAGIAVATTGALLSVTIPAPPPPGLQSDPVANGQTVPAPPGTSMDYSRPATNLILRPQPNVPVAGEPVNLGIDLTDGSTGRAVDDLLVHDAALIHLVVIGPNDQFWHIHPVRGAPGHYLARFVPRQAGDYGVFAELGRRGGGIQLLRAVLPVHGQASGQRDSAQGLGERTIGGMRVSVNAAHLTAGEPTTLSLRFATAGGAVTDLQPWLGMLGHLLILGPMQGNSDCLDGHAAGCPIFAHVHAMSTTTSTTRAQSVSASVPDETVAAYGPEVDFTYTFPVPGRYRLWAQVEHDYEVLTIPILLDVPASGGATG